ncbi:aminoglycoside adenylyltransferase domain-containing protein [Nocardioides sp.]|uniref:aminoglycoside adenylyltransferase domain-containing protein n=1 Tax=Nocardioides sp. TaxID=35761 RepID=UPI002736A099|nr:aminoglycoside adenylyltransferase domain-containing protein [Nocardioides sp.]MDP3890073.1 DUF4111 domain-containing protein [Nocardioides sp.]
MSLDLPAPAHEVCTTFLAEIDSAAQGLVTGLYLRGGLGFGEFVPGRSDVDFVATLARRPGSTDVEALRGAHATVAERHPGQPFDGLHVLAGDLAAPPDDCPDVPCVIHGLFEPVAREDLNPVAWHEVARHGVTVRGPQPAALDVWTDDEVLLAFTRENLDTYWRDSAAALAKFPAEAGTETSCEWCVLGVARLHHLLVTGAMTTKSGAGRWGLTHYDERFHPVLREALRIREGGIREYDDVALRGTDAAAFTAYVVDAGTSPDPGRRR